MGNSRTWQRARRPEQKEERRQAILAAAGRLLDADGLEGTGLNAIGRAAGSSKANLYRYFESREAILLELLDEEQEAWLQALDRRLRRLAGRGDIEAIARALGATLAGRPRLCVLLAALPSVLERNVSAERVVAHKRRALELLAPVLESLRSALPGLGHDEAQAFVVQMVMAVCGFWPHCNPAPVVARVVERSEFATLRMDFEAITAQHAETLLRGLMCGKNEA